MKRLAPTHEIELFERNAPDDTFGWGVVFSGRTVDALAHADAVDDFLRAAIHHRALRTREVGDARRELHLVGRYAEPLAEHPALEWCLVDAEVITRLL